MGGSGRAAFDIGGSALCNRKRDSQERWSQQDHWAACRFEGGAVCVVADGMSQWDWSSAMATLACESFIEGVMRAMEERGGPADGYAIVKAAFEHAVARCHAERRDAGDEGGAAIVAAFATAGGQVWTVQAGDARIWGRKKGQWLSLTTSGHKGASGGLTHYLGKPPEAFADADAFISRQPHRDLDMIVAATDGFYEPLENIDALERELEDKAVLLPDVMARELALRAVSLDSRDNITVAVLSVGAAEAQASTKAARIDLSVPVLVCVALLFAVIGAIASALAIENAWLPAPPLEPAALTARAADPVGDEIDGEAKGDTKGSAEGEKEGAPEAGAAPAMSEEERRGWLKALERNMGKDCREAVDEALKGGGEAFGLVYTTERAREAAPPEPGQPFDPAGWRGAYGEFLKACPSINGECIGEDPVWWILELKKSKGTSSGWTWGEALTCLNRAPTATLTREEPLVRCALKGKGERVRCEVRAE